MKSLRIEEITMMVQGFRATSEEVLEDYLALARKHFEKNEYPEYFAVEERISRIMDDLKGYDECLSLLAEA